MIRMVPTPKPDSNFNSDLDPNHSLEQVVHNIDSTFTDFDLSFLPSAGDCCNLDELPDSPSIGKNRGRASLKFHDFSITRILREINFGDSRSAKFAISIYLEALNFDSYEFLHFLKSKIDQINNYQNS